MVALLVFQAILALFLLICWIERSRRRIDHIPGPRMYPVVGNLPHLILMMRQGAFEYLRECRKKYGVIFKLHLSGNTFVLISDPAYIRTLLTSTENLTRPFFISMFETWTGKGLTSTTGALWHSRRKILEPTFSRLKIKVFISSTTEICENLCKNLQRFDGQEINLLSTMRELSVKLAYDHFFNLKLEKSRLEQVTNDNGEIMYFLMHRFIRPWLWNEFLYSWTTNASKEKAVIERLRGMSHEAISIAKRNNHDEELNGETRISFLDYLIECQKEDSTLTDEQITAQLDNFVFAVFNSLPMVITTVLYFMGTDDSIQDKVREEVNSIFTERLSSERVPTMEQLLRLKYLESVVNETFRFANPPLILGRCTTEEILFGNYRVPAGSNVIVDWNAVHHDEKYYSTPYEFNPEHFYNLEEVRHRPFHAFLPFGKSLRVCLAEKYARMVIKLVLSIIIQNFRIESTQSLEELMKFQLQGIMEQKDRAKSIFVRIKNINSN